jgi:succinate dehydrogenase/fumarate reductase flavoprotein subunit
MSDVDVDVLVLGFGAAGAAAAIEADDAGASVLVAEKLSFGGGNCLNSGGFLFDLDGPAAVDHLDALCFGKTPRPVLSAFADGLHELPAWLRSLGGAIAPVDPQAFGGMLPSWPHFPGAGHVSYALFDARDEERPGPGLFALLRRGVERRGIEVRYEAPASELIVEAGVVVGAVVGGGVVRAGSVILTAGGFEYDAHLCDAYLPVPVIPVGHPGNTGDSVRLASRAGAALWHMSAFFGWFAFSHPDYGAGFPLDVHGSSFIYVDADGRRFGDETGWEVHDKVRCLTAYLPRRRNYPHMPGHIVFDEAARLAGPLNGIVGTPNDYVWSADNSVEVDAGWITRADSVEELAAVIGAPELPATLCSYGSQPDEFGRAPETMVALQPPLYAIQMHPGVATASGGACHDSLARALRSDGSAVPGLYVAGAAGSIWGHLTEHGGGLADAMVFGRIAGAAAAAGSGPGSGAGRSVAF